MGKSGKRVLIGALAFAMAFTGLMPGGTRPALALIVAERISTVNTAVWTPNAPGPSGVAYRSSTSTLVVVDSDKNNEPGNPTTNLWEYSLTTGQVVYSATLNITGDATGVSWDSANGRLFVSSDSAAGVYVFGPDGSGRFGGDEDAFIDVGTLITPFLPVMSTPDIEDSAYDASTDHLFVLNGNSSQVFEISPGVDTDFGTPDDVLVGTGFLVQQDVIEDPDDWEAMALDASTGHLLVGAKEEPVIFELEKTGVFLDSIDTSDITSAGELGSVPPLTTAGLTVQPAGGGEPKTYWIADRADTTPVTTNDGRLHRIHPGPVTVPDEPPAINPTIPAQSGNESTLITFQATAVDDFGDELTWSLDPGFPQGAAITADGLFTWTPTEAQGRGAPAYTVRVRVTDAAPGNNFDFQDVLITANEVNQAPVAVAFSSLIRAEGDSVSVQLLASDGDVPAQTKTWNVAGLPSGLSFGTTTGLISGTVGASAASGSPYSVTVTVTDSGSPAMNDQFTFIFTIEDGTGPGPGPGPGPSPGPNPDPMNPFVDDDGHIFENAIEWLDANGITAGCNPPTNDRFCPNDNVTRGQMATFLVRALHYTEIADDYFIDDNGNIFENAINRLRTAGVTQGCNPPTNNRFCPDGFVTRGQMAAFLVRALDLPAFNGPDRFVDDNGHIFEGAIERLAQAGITVGCNPPANDRFCPNDRVTRGQMAAFLKRALEG